MGNVNAETPALVKAPLDLEPIQAYNHDRMVRVGLPTNDNGRIQQVHMDDLKYLTANQHLACGLLLHLSG